MRALLRPSPGARPGRASGAFTAQPHRRDVLENLSATCDATAAKPPSELGRRIARPAMDEFTRFGGHQIDANGRCSASA